MTKPLPRRSRAPAKKSSAARGGVNDFTIKMANVNGTGSASANGLLSKAIFRMGVPIAAKNFFPSNIQGLPTWYEVRVSGKGYEARSGRVHVMVAMNAQTYAQDIAEIEPGGYLLYDSSWPMSTRMLRDDITVLGIPLARICAEHFDKARTRILMKNVVYVGALAALLNLDLRVIQTLIEEQFASKPKLVPLNMKAIEMGLEYARNNFDCPLPFRVRTLEATQDQIMIEGNAAAGLGCLYAGATVGAWYPITPSTSLMDAFANFCKLFREDENGRRYAIVQAEDELAAIGMVLGASWNGARSFTCTSGPGISLMSEFIGLAYFAEIPVVVFDIQRVGPSTGMPTRTQQCDIMTCAYASHGDTRHVMLLPANPAECFHMAVQAFDLAERLQTPVFVLSDLDIGMNEWPTPRLQWDDDYRPDRGKVLDADDLEKIEHYYRYLDVDGDGIAARTLPGVHPKGAYFTRGSGHTKYGGYTENPDDYIEVVDRLNKKFRLAAGQMPKADIKRARGCRVGLVAYGSSHGAAVEALDLLRSSGIILNYLRIKAFPFGPEVTRFLQAQDVVYVVDQNRDAQMTSLLTLETEVDREKLIPVLHYGGFPLHAGAIVDAIAQDQRHRKTA